MTLSTPPFTAHQPPTRRGAVLLAALLTCAASGMAQTAAPTAPVDVPITRGTIELGSIRPSLGTGQRPAPTPAEASPQAAPTTPTAPTAPAATAATTPATPTPTAATATTTPANPPRTVADFAAIAKAKAAADAAAKAAGLTGTTAPTATAAPSATSPSTAPGGAVSPATPPAGARVPTATPAAVAAPTATAAPTADTPKPTPGPATPALARPSARPVLNTPRVPTPRTPQAAQDEGMGQLAERILEAIARAEAKQPTYRATNKPASSGKTRADTPGAAPASAPAKATASRDELRTQASALAAQVSGKPEVFLSPPTWGYEDPVGPANWHTLRPDYATCATGQRQSPIALDSSTSLQGPAEAIDFRYDTALASVLNNGHTLQVDLAPGNWLSVRGTRYELLQLNFHHPAEEHINGQTHPMSVHLVHRSSEGELAVLAVQLNTGAANPVVNTLWTHMPLDSGDRVPLPSPGINPMGLLPADQRYYQYLGSLTTPPCTEGVLWLVLKTPVTLSAAQITLFGQLFPNNARPAQPTHERPVREAL